MPVAIVGMHRSGTSLLARMLNHAGLWLGPEDRLLGPAFDNPQGFWEHTGFSRVNDAVLAELGGSWDAPPAVPVTWRDDPRLAVHLDRARSLLAEFRGREWWGWKDPRTTLTLPLWQELIPELRVVLSLRNPLEVGVSLQRRNGFSYSKAIRLWQLYYHRALQPAGPPRLVVSYERVLSAPEAELERVLGFLGVEAGSHAVRAAAGARRQDLRHTRFENSELSAVRCHPDIIDLYAQLQAEAESGGQDAERLLAERLPCVPSADRILDERAMEALVALRPAAILAADRSLVGSPELRTGENVQVETEILDGVKSSLREHLAESLRVVLDSQADERDLLGEGLIDSMAVMELVAFIEEKFDVIVEDEEIVAENFRSLDGMAGYVVYKKTGVEVAPPYVVQVREFVVQATPAGAFVLLLTSGDDRLLRVPDRQVWPFPCDEQGTWCGTGHPADGPQAVAMVERMRELGATHIVFLDPELWWLEYYQGLRAHLERAGGARAQSSLGVAYAL